MRDYRDDQRWWNEKIQWLGLTRNEVVWVVVGLAIASLFYKFPIHWDWVFGLRHK